MRKFGIFIGRFQPFHNAHLNAVGVALANVEKLIIVLGSACQARTVKNPWTTSERKAMILSCFTEEDRNRIYFVDAKDYLYNDNLWLTAVQEKINTITHGSNDVILIGHKKDRSTFYLGLFPQWEFIDTGDLTPGSEGTGLAATRVRELYFKCDLITIKNIVPNTVFDILQSTMMSGVELVPEFRRLKDEFDHIEEYKELWANAPFPPTFVTVDGVVIKSGHVLVVRRKCQPGKGLIALPGGFINQYERIKDACLRELKEETRIKLSKQDIKAKLVDQKVFDHPNRSLRGRTISHSFCFNLGHGPLPKVKGNDDADHAWWMPLRDVFAQEEDFFEDHFHIISYFVNRF